MEVSTPWGELAVAKSISSPPCLLSMSPAPRCQSPSMVVHCWGMNPRDLVAVLRTTEGLFQRLAKQRSTLWRSWTIPHRSLLACSVFTGPRNQDDQGSFLRDLKGRIAVISCLVGARNRHFKWDFSAGLCRPQAIRTRNGWLTVKSVSIFV